MNRRSSRYLQDSQVREPLRIAEIWSYPLFLRMAIIEHLAALATSVACAQRCREAAQLWADRLTAAARRGNDEFNRMLARIESEAYVRAPHFLTVLAEQLQGEENTFASVQHWIEERLKQPRHGSGAGGAYAGSRGKRRDGASVWQPSSSVSTRLHEDLRGSQPGGGRIAAGSSRDLRP